MDGLAEELGVHPVRLPTLKRAVGLGDVLALAFLVRVMRSWRPDILHTHASKAGALGRVAALLAGPGRPRIVVHTFHGHVLEGYFSARVSALVAAIERLLARTTNCLVAVSEEVRDDLVRLRVAGRERVEVVPVGFELSVFDVPDGERRARRELFRSAVGIPLGARVVTLVARIEPIKRVDRFLRIAEHVGTDGVHFMVVGDGALRRRLESSPQAQNLRHKLTWTGLRNDMPDVYFGSDLVAVTSDNEGTAVSAIEAQAAGLPVVSTRVGGMPAVVVHGETGFLLEPSEEAAFAAVIDEILADEDLARRLGASGAKRAVEKFSLDRLVRDIDSLYRRLLSQPRG